jgi:hypothetical protein
MQRLLDDSVKLRRPALPPHPDKSEGGDSRKFVEYELATNN